MRQQPVPSLTDSDFQRLVTREFPLEHTAAARAILARYGGQSWQRESIRVQIAVMKLANGNLAKLDEFMKVAEQDYRDVLSWAEYPAYHRTGPRSADAERQAAMDEDWIQYQQWLAAS